jgi:hypothetical protein
MDQHRKCCTWLDESPVRVSPGWLPAGVASLVVLGPYSPVYDSNYGCGIQLNADRYTPPGDGIITSALIEDNVLYDNGAGGGGTVNLDGVLDSVIRKNLLFNNHASGIILFQIDGAEGPRGNWIYHNTVDQAANGRWALGLKQATGTNYVRNNVLYSRHTSPAQRQVQAGARKANSSFPRRRRRRRSARQFVCPCSLKTSTSIGFDRPRRRSRRTRS